MSAAAGFFGKIPARGDFVRCGLPGEFIAAWDAWLQEVIPISRELLGEDWLPAWLEAPVWRFALDHGVCGTEAVLGLWMPSVDRAGRHFPLTLALVVPRASARRLAQEGAGWLDAAERAGLDAVAKDTPPEQLALALSAAPPPLASAPEEASDATGISRWWTEGAPRVAARTLETVRLPDGLRFAAMLDDRAAQAREHVGEARIRDAPE
jgi:type VI secretion system protein ImpM